MRDPKFFFLNFGKILKEAFDGALLFRQVLRQKSLSTKHCNDLGLPDGMYTYFYTKY
jgi:hypothetical protein